MVKPSSILEGKELAAILETMADGVFVLDTIRHVRCWNRAMEGLTGFSSAEIVGSACGSFAWLELEPTPESQADAVFCRLFAAGSLDRTELTVRRKDGTRLPVLVSARVLAGPDGAPSGAVVNVTDLSTIRRLEHELTLLREEVTDRYRLHNLVGKSPAMRQVFNLAELAATSQATVLIHGETGTGKELVAKAIHYQGERRKGPMVTVNCSALSETLVESELFGHVRGAFTGAVKDHIGRFERAGGGTLFLDEIGEIPLSVQVKLLRVIQEREIERIGETQPRRVDVRIIAATHRDLREEVERGRFREDLYYRLKVFPIEIPPLRERREDIAVLVPHFIGKYVESTGKNVRGIQPDAMRMIMDYCWPGNVRELENAIEHAFVTCAGTEIEPVDLPLEMRRAELKERICGTPRPVSKPLPETAKKPRKSSSSDLLAVLEACDWNKAEAARRLGISRTQIWRRMLKLGIPMRPDAE